ncbi:unnamed protein product [Gongylonema pulchrum]|uniref:Uncharacterized protein n=1 Tax=Gongylonema pulchrum TaxID=637853 RepID=A0A183E3Y9_9BILA|nr:unnamed protein product [Gongylonema pulchrum]
MNKHSIFAPFQNQILQEKFHEFEKNDAYMCVCKTFIRWLDRHIFELFIEGLRKTKIVREAEDEGILLHNPEILARTTSAGIDSPREKKDSFCELPDEKVPFSLDEDVEGQNALDVETSSGILAETNPAKERSGAMI